jgi:cytochrome b561
MVLKLNRLLHWALVTCVIIAYVSAYYRDFFTTQLQSANWYLLVIHINIGIFILLLSAIMLIIHIKSQQKKKLSTAKVMHFSLYCMMILLPLSAYIGTGFDLSFLGVVNFPGFFRSDVMNNILQEYFGLLMFTFIEPFSGFHQDIGADILLPIMLIGHIGAAIYHQLK